MRTPPRKSRPFRPSALALEAICPVSSLATALPLAASAIAGPSGTPQAHRDPAPRPPAVSTPIVAAPRTAPKPMPGPARPNLGVGPVLATASTTATPATASTVLVTPAQYGNAITIASANVPANRPSSGAPSSPTHGGGAAPAQASVRPMSAPVAAPTTSTVAPPPPVFSLPTTGPTPAPSSPPTGIRPMTLVATPRVSAFATPTGTAMANDQTVSGSDSGSYSSSGSDSSSGSGSASDSGSSSDSSSDNGPPGNASMIFSGGGYIGPDGNSDNEVGAGVTAILSADRAIQSVEWNVSGAIDHLDYPSDYEVVGPDREPYNNHTDTFTEGQNATEDFSSFNWDENPGFHTATAVVNFFQGPPVTVTRTSNNTAPTATFTIHHAALGYGSYNTIDQTGQVIPQYGIHLGDKFGTPSVIGATYTATVTIPAAPQNANPADFGGTFGFLQLASINDSATYNNGDVLARKSAGWGIDTRTAVADQPAWGKDVFLGRYESGYVLPGSNGVSIPDGIQAVTDSPQLGVLQSGYNKNPEFFVKTISMNENYEAYLMFKSPTGLWVPISKASWNLSATIDYAGGGNWNLVQPPPVDPPIPPVQPATPGDWTGSATTTVSNYKGRVQDVLLKKQ